MTAQDENGSNCISSNKRDEESIKVRKPYTITKQRERWTEEEHTKFLDALKQYGRAWRRIEEHVGTKTAVQIRSHAQKFFSKVERESNGDDLKSVEPIEIPPPRPKRKPMHPYPRKLVIITPVRVPQKPTRSVSPNEKESQSPTSVLFSLDSEAQASADSSPNASPSCVSSATEASTTRYLKLFGKTVLVNEYPTAMESVINPVIPSLPWGLRCAPVQVHSPVPIKARRYNKDVEENEDAKEGSSTCSNSDSSSSSFKPTKIVMLKQKSASSTKRTKGFLPYKRCLAERAIHSQTIASEEMEKQRTRLCL